MTREQVKQLFKIIVSVYPNFDVDSTKLNIWTSLMRDMDYQRVLEKTKDYMQKNKFPPTIADISAFKPKENEYLEKIIRWKKESEKVPNELKQEFKNKLLQLVRDKNA